MTDILGIGSSGLTAYRKLLEVVGGNITNANTDGYARRGVVTNVTGNGTMSATSLAVGSGAGVSVDTVQRATNTFLQSESLRANSVDSQSQTYADSLSQLEKSFVSSGLNPGNEVQTFYNHFQDLANSPTLASSRLALIASGDRTAEVFRASATSITGNLSTTRLAIDAGLTSVNGITDQLAKLNTALDSSSSGPQKANDLLDLRDKLLQQLSKLTNFTTTESSSGAVNVYLGDTASGRRLVGPDGAHKLGAVETGSRLDIVFDPYTAPVTTSQLTSGSIGGLLDFRRETSSLLDSINQLAVGFANAINNQHMQGVDAQGQPGGAMFSTDGLLSSASPANLGSAKVSVTVTDAAMLASGNYQTTFNADKGLWTVTTSDGRAATGANDIHLDGLKFSFEGQASNGDTFFLDPLKNAAASMSFLRHNPNEIATALPIYVDADTANTGTGEVSVKKGDLPSPVTTIPSASALYGAGQSKTADFQRDGSVFVLPAGTNSATIASLSQLSAVHFRLDSSMLAELSQSGPTLAASARTLTINLDANSNSVSAISLALNPKTATLAGLADAINAAATKANQQDKIYASVNNGVLSINALGAHTISNGTIGGQDSAGQHFAFAGTNEAGIPAADIQVFTREGRQLSGPQLSAEAASALITTANGFLPEAKYEFTPIGNTSRYPGVDLQDTSQLLAVKTPDGGNGSQVTVDVAADPQNNTTQTGLDGAITSGAVYALDINGLPPVRLSGDALAGKDAAATTDALLGAVNQLASTRSWIGGAVDLSGSTMKDGQFKITVDRGDGNPTTQLVTFHRGQGPAPDYALQETGTFDVAGSSGLKLSLVTDANNVSHVMITLPAQMSTTAPKLTFSSDAAVNTLGLSGVITSKLTGSADLATELLRANAPALNVEIGGVAKSLVIDAPTGFSNGVAWSTVNGRLQLASDDPTMQVVADAASAALGFNGAEPAGARISATDTIANAYLSAHPVTLNVLDQAGLRTVTINGASGADSGIEWGMTGGRLTLTGLGSVQIASASAQDRDKAASLGFLGTDLDVTSSGTQLQISSTANDASKPLASGAASVSRIASAVGFKNAIGEDLIVAVSNSDASGMRRLAVDLPGEGATDPVNNTPNILVKVKSATELEIIDPTTNLTIANRKWTADQPVSFRGLTFTITGKAQTDDVFKIVNDPTRTGDNRNALAIAALANADTFGNGQGSFQDVYTSVAAQLGAKVNAANVTAATAKSAASDLKSAYESVAGVNLDTEAADLIRYQQAYQAAAQVVMAARDMFATILKSF